MKKVKILSCLVVILLLSLTGYALVSAENAVGVVTASVLNIREEPSTSSNVIGKLVKGDIIEILSREGDWYKIDIKSAQGYVFAEYVSFDVNSVTSRGKNTSKATELLEYAKRFVGVKYKYGGASPKTGFDCSGFVQYVYRGVGIELPHSSAQQSMYGTYVDKSDLQPGDLVFFATRGKKRGISHVGIYIGNGQFIHARSYGKTVGYDTLTSGFYSSTYVTARRVLK